MNKDFFILGKTEKKSMNFVFACIVAFLLITAGSLIGIVGEFMPNLPEYIKLSVFSLTLSFGLGAIFIFLYVKFKEKRAIKTLGFEKEGFFKKYILGFVVGLVFFAVVVLIGVMFGAIELTINPSGFKAHIILAILFGFLIQGATEEILCRGWLMQTLGNRYSPWFAVIVSSLFFMVLHGMNPGITALPLINLFLFGVFAAVYTINEKGLWGICGFHSAWNWVQGSVFGIKVSGTTVPGGSVLSSNMIENKDLIHGGAFGIEGSVICSAVFIAGTILILVLMKKKRG